MRYPNWRHSTTRPVLRAFEGPKRSWEPPSRWWPSLIRRFTERCLKSPGTMRSQPISPIAIRSADTDFTGLRMRRSPTATRSALGNPLKQARIITLQLGNGCSVAAIDKGKSVDTSMGFTPLEGLVMGTRSGDVDPSIVSYLSEREKVEPAEVEGWLNQRSGLLGLSGRSNDMRELLRAVEQEGDQRAEFAIDLFCYRARKYLGAYLAVLGGADAIVFGGGIGENAPEVRKRICRNMEWCGMNLHPDRNRTAVGLNAGSAGKISTDDSRVAVYVVAADEETWIAKETARCVRAIN